MTQTTVSVTEGYGTVPINYLSYEEEEEEERRAKRVQWLFIFQFWKASTPISHRLFLGIIL